MLSMALITNCDCDDPRPPIPHESFCSSIENGLATDDLGSSAIYLTGASAAAAKFLTTTPLPVGR